MIARTETQFAGAAAVPGPLPSTAEEDAFGLLPPAFEPDSLQVTFFFDPSTR